MTAWSANVLNKLICLVENGCQCCGTEKRWAPSRSVSLNPTAARRALGDRLAGISAAFFEEAVPLIDGPWTIAASFDLVDPQTRGQRPADLESRLRFGVVLNRIAARDPAVHKLTLEVQHLLKPRSALLTPELGERVQAEMERS
jgi:hypothetical protein